MTYRYIYKITCTTGSFKGKFYYGQHTTKNLDDGYKGSGVMLRRYYEKYPNDYIKEILAFYDSKEELNQAEYDIIKPWLGNPMCLNLKDGGKGGAIVGRHLSEETRKKLSESLKGRISPNKGKHLSEETKRKISEAHKGNPKCSIAPWNKGKHGLQTAWNKGKHHSEETRKKLSESHKGKDLLEETKRKISEAHKGKIKTEEHRKHLSESRKGKKFGHLSEEHKRKIAESLKGKKRGPYKKTNNN